MSAAPQQPLFSPDWHRVAALRPRLRPSVRVQRQPHRNQVWYQLADAGSGRRHRLNEAAYRFVARLDGHRTAQQAWDEVVAQYSDAALNQTDAIRLLGQLSHAGLLQSENNPDVERLFRESRRQLRSRRLADLNPLAVRVRLFNPAPLLQRFDPWLPVLLHPILLLVWLGVVGSALLLAGEHWSELTAYALTHADSLRYVVIAWVVYPLMKAAHEFSHALTVRRFGGGVTEAGFTLLVLVPAPYIDASAASAFAQPYQRALVSAAGILTELFLAGLALFVWLNVQAGWVSDIAFVTLLLGAVSTLLINGNPLLRFDGYHVLCDVLDIPNLDQRSRAWWLAMVQRRLLAMPPSAPLPPLAAGERKWLAGYAPLALAFRAYAGMLIAYWMSTQSLLLGLLTGVAMVAGLFVFPAIRLTRSVTQIGDARARRHGLRLLGGGAAVALAVVTLLPLPYGTVAPGVVWLPERAELRAETDGIVSELKVRDGDRVQPGTLLAVLDDPELLAKQDEARSRLAGLRVQYFGAMETDRVQAQNFAQALQHAETEAAYYDERVATLEIRARTAGRVVLPRQEDIPGTFLKKGETLGYVFTPGEVIVRTAVADEDGGLLRERVRGASIWLEEWPGKTVQGTVRRDVPASSFKLPNAALSDRNGGSILTDPTDSDNLRTLQPVFTVDVALADATAGRGVHGGADPLGHIGGRAWVRFDFGSASLAVQWAQGLGRLLLTQMGKVV